MQFKSDMLPTELLQAKSEADIVSVARNNIRLDRFAEDFVRNTDHGCFKQFRKTEQLILDLLATDTFSTAFNEVAGAIDNIDEAVSVDGGKISGVKLAIAK